MNSFYQKKFKKLSNWKTKINFFLKFIYDLDIILNRFLNYKIFQFKVVATGNKV